MRLLDLLLPKSLRSSAPPSSPRAANVRVVGSRPRLRGGAIPVSGGGYAGASIDRLTASLASWSSSPNAALDGSLSVLRARARQLSNDGGYGRRFLSLLDTNVVGPCGPTLQVRAYQSNGDLDKPANAAVERAWGEWARVCDITGRLGLAQFLGLTIRAVARDGEALIRLIKRRDLPGGIALQGLEVDRLDERLNVRLANGNSIRLGVEIDTTGRPVAYHVTQGHPGDTLLGDRPLVERVPASEIIHVFIPDRFEQVRGVTWFHAVIRDLAMLEGYEEAAIVAARVGASKMGFFQRPTDEDAAPTGGAASAVSDTDTTSSPGGALQMSAEPGEFYELPAGYAFQGFNPDYPHQAFDAFVKAILRSISSGLNVDYPTLANDLAEVNYSSMRAGSLQTRDEWMRLQAWFIGATCSRIFAEWLPSALVRGEIVMDRGTVLPADRLSKFAGAAKFIGRRWAWIDPLKDAQASRELIDARLASRTEIAASQGRDIEDILEELSEEEEQIREAGLAPAPTVAPPAIDEGEDAGEDASEDEVEGEDDSEERKP